MRFAIALASLALGACSHTHYLDKPRTVTVYVPVTAPIDAELIVDCVPASLAGRSVGAALDRLKSVEWCLKDTRDRLAKLRAAQPKSGQTAGPEPSP